MMSTGRNYSEHFSPPAGDSKFHKRGAPTIPLQGTTMRLSLEVKGAPAQTMLAPLSIDAYIEPNIS